MEDVPYGGGYQPRGRGMGRGGPPRGGRGNFGDRGRGERGGRGGPLGRGGRGGPPRGGGMSRGGSDRGGGGGFGMGGGGGGRGRGMGMRGRGDFSSRGGGDSRGGFQRDLCHHTHQRLPTTTTQLSLRRTEHPRTEGTNPTGATRRTEQDTQALVATRVRTTQEATLPHRWTPRQGMAHHLLLRVATGCSQTATPPITSQRLSSTVTVGTAVDLATTPHQATMMDIPLVPVLTMFLVMVEVMGSQNMVAVQLAMASLVIMVANHVATKRPSDYHILCPF